MEYTKFNSAGYSEVHKLLFGTWGLILRVRRVFACKKGEIKPMQS